jgi:hypothetical protein
MFRNLQSPTYVLMTGVCISDLYTYTIQCDQRGEREKGRAGELIKTNGNGWRVLWWRPSTASTVLSPHSIWSHLNIWKNTNHIYIISYIHYTPVITMHDCLFVKKTVRKRPSFATSGAEFCWKNRASTIASLIAGNNDNIVVHRYRLGRQRPDSPQGGTLSPRDEIIHWVWRPFVFPSELLSST